MTRVLAAALLAAHGLIHLLGFVALTGLATVDGFAYRTTALGGVLSFGDAGARLLGIAWLLVAVGFVLAAVAVVRRRRWAKALVAGLAGVSLALCVLALPEAGFGITVNAVILSVLVLLALRPAPSGAPAA
jgi:hypothetical protein